MKYYATIAFVFALLASAIGFAVVCYLELQASRRRDKVDNKVEANRDIIPAVGELAEKFGSAGGSASVLACSVLFMLIGTAIALALDDVHLAKLFFGQ